MELHKFLVAIKKRLTNFRKNKQGLEKRNKFLCYFFNKV